MLVIICLFWVAVIVLAERRVKQFRRERQAESRSYALESVMKELATWDRVKELGFNDVVDWELAFEKAVGALPEGSRVKELEKEREAKQQAEVWNTGQYMIAPGTPIRTVKYNEVHGVTFRGY